jgi:hypothetical protein
MQGEAASNAAGGASNAGRDGDGGEGGKRKRRGKGRGRGEGKGKGWESPRICMLPTPMETVNYK